MNIQEKGGRLQKSGRCPDGNALQIIKQRDEKGKLPRHAAQGCVKPMKTLQLNAEENSGLKWLPRTPAMAAGLTDHIWTLKEVFRMVVIGKQHSTG